MNRKDLITAVAASTNESKVLVERIVYAIFDKAIPEKLAEGTIVSINDFGKFVPKVQAAKVGRNPSTGLSVDIPEKMKLTFKPATKLKNTIN